MSDLKEYTDGFKLNYEKFLIGCDAIEEEGAWPRDVLGEMDAYFVNDFMCVIIRLIAADGVFKEEEVEYLNRAMGFSFTTEELREVYEECGDRIAAMLDIEITDSLQRLSALNLDLAGAYRQMLVMLCRIITESDGALAPEEAELAKQLNELLERPTP